MAAWVPLALTAASMIYDQLNKPEYKGLKPEDIKGMQYTDMDLRRDMNMFRGQLEASGRVQSARIQSMGAANRLPAGAVMGGLAGVQEKTSQGMERILPQLRGVQRQSQGGYLSLLNQIHQGQMGYEQGQHDRTLEGFGTLSNIATLWSAGYLNKQNTGKN